MARRRLRLAAKPRDTLGSPWLSRDYFFTKPVAVGTAAQRNRWLARMAQSFADDFTSARNTTAIVLWAFMGQVLRDGNEASCQSAVARISSYLGLRSQDDVDPDTRDYCRAPAKLPEAALHELTTTIANEAGRLVEPQHLWKGRHAKSYRPN